jgi:hypothetical protein
MVVVGVEAPVRLPLPSLIIRALSPSATSTLFHRPTLFVASPPSSQAASLLCALFPTRAPHPVSPPNNGVVVLLGREPVTPGGSHQAWASLPAVRCGGVARTWPQGVAGAARWLCCLLHALPRAQVWDAPTSLLLGAPSSLSFRAAAPQPERDLVDCSLHFAV